MRCDVIGRLNSSAILYFLTVCTSSLTGSSSVFALIPDTDPLVRSGLPTACFDFGLIRFHLCPLVGRGCPSLFTVPVVFWYWWNLEIGCMNHDVFSGKGLLYLVLQRA